MSIFYHPFLNLSSVSHLGVKSSERPLLDERLSTETCSTTVLYSTVVILMVKTPVKPFEDNSLIYNEAGLINCDQSCAIYRQNKLFQVNKLILNKSLGMHYCMYMCSVNESFRSLYLSIHKSLQASINVSQNCWHQSFIQVY